MRQLQTEKAAFDEFLDAVEAISTSDNPLLLLKSARTATGGMIGNTYMVEVSVWQAFYYADAAHKICVGLLVCRSDLDFDERVQMVANALGRHR